jgi:hypothetical protein
MNHAKLVRRVQSAGGLHAEPRRPLDVRLGLQSAADIGS